MGLTYETALRLLEENEQGHVLRFWDRLNDVEQAALVQQIEALDCDSIERMQGMLAETQETGSAHAEMIPAEVVTLAEAEKKKTAMAAGEAALRAGKVGVIVVAGGQGSRLGFDGPKGSYVVGVVSQASLFEIHARKILALERRYNTEIPFYIMTSQANDQATRDFFSVNQCFGLSPDSVHFFSQGMWPALTKDGKIMLDAPGHIFMSPDGHGGIVSALRDRGMLADMAARGLEMLFFFQVDNPLVEVAHPMFIGLHAEAEADISVKVCAKRDPDEGLGVVVQRGDSQAIVEYTELTDEQKRATMPDGNLRYRFGSVAIHVFSFAFLKREAETELPLHIANKKVPYCLDDGTTVKPEVPNARKFEKFIFDVIPDARKVLNLEFAREEEFSPVKNADGEDSPATAQRDMIRKAARQLEAAGVTVPRGADGEPLHKIEIDPCYEVTGDEVITGDVYLTEESR